MGTAAIWPNATTKSFQRIVRKFVAAGMHLSSPVDAVPEGKIVYGKNVRGYLTSPLQGRPGLTKLWPLPVGTGLCHSIRRLNDDSVAYGGFTRIYGIGTVLYHGPTNAFSVQAGFSGNPLTLVEFRPPESAAPWMYVADSTLIWKVNSAGTGRPIGYRPPAAAPSVALASGIVHTVINDCDTAADWSNTTQTGWPANTAGAATLLTGATGRINAGAVTITTILFDTGTTGWACINPSAATAFGEGLRFTFNGGAVETVICQAVHSGSGTATTIGSIIYDSGTTGLCSIQLAIEIDEIERNSLIWNSTIGIVSDATALARVLSVTVNPDGTKSLRCSTSVAWAATNAINALPCVRAYCANTHAAAETLRADAIRTAVTVGTGYLTDAIAIDLSRVTGKPIQPEDWLHLSVRVDRPDLVSEIKVLLDVDAGTTTGLEANSAFQLNYYFYAFRPSDLTPAIRQSATFSATAPTAVQRDLIDNYDPETGQYLGSTVGGGTTDSSEPLAQTGDTQWYEVWFRVSELTRVGTDTSKTLANVKASRISVIATGSINLDFDSFWIGGGYGPDALKSVVGYYYRWRYRDSTTGAKSRWSQPTRSPIVPIRQRVTLTVTSVITNGIDKVDFQRFGGERPTWTYIGTSASAAGTVTFNDDLTDLALEGKPTDEDEVRAPFPVIDIPQSGTGYAAGTTFIASTGTFSVNWARGMAINVNGLDYTVAVVLTTTKLETVESMGTQGSSGSPIAWYAPRPVIEQAPLPSMWGPVDGIIYACGDTRNQGTLYGSANNDADSSPETHQLEVTSPSEPLMAGCAYDDSSYVYSDRRMFRIFRDAQYFATAHEVPNGKGLFSQWGLAVGPAMWSLAKDGIYESKGGAGASITDADLYPLFPHDGIQPTSIDLGGITVVPPDMDIAVASVAGNLRLSYYDSMLYFDYLGIDALYHTLVYNTITKAWLADEYARNINLHYGESGHGIRNLFACGNASDDVSGMSYLATGTSDDGDAISGQLRTPSLDRDDPGTKKLWQDVQLDCAPNGVAISVQQGFNQHETTLAAQLVTGTTRTKSELPSNSNAGEEAYNADLDITWSSAIAAPQFFGWEQMALGYPREVRALQTIETSHGIGNYQHHRLYAVIPLISTDTVTLRIAVDGAIFSYPIASTAGALRKTLVPLNVMKGKVFSYRLSSDSVFRVFSEDIELAVKGWGDAGPYRLVNPFGGGSVVA